MDGKGFYLSHPHPHCCAHFLLPNSYSIRKLSSPWGRTTSPFWKSLPREFEICKSTCHFRENHRDVAFTVQDRGKLLLASLFERIKIFFSRYHSISVLMSFIKSNIESLVCYPGRRLYPQWLIFWIIEIFFDVVLKGHLGITTWYLY